MESADHVDMIKLHVPHCIKFAKTPYICTLYSNASNKAWKNTVSLVHEDTCKSSIFFIQMQTLPESVFCIILVTKPPPPQPPQKNVEVWNQCKVLLVHVYRIPFKERRIFFVKTLKKDNIFNMPFNTLSNNTLNKDKAIHAKFAKQTYSVKTPKNEMKFSKPVTKSIIWISNFFWPFLSFSLNKELCHWTPIILAIPGSTCPWIGP